jgi:hypothetical protein
VPSWRGGGGRGSEGGGVRAWASGQAEGQGEAPTSTHILQRLSLPELSRVYSHYAVKGAVAAAKTGQAQASNPHIKENSRKKEIETDLSVIGNFLE